EGGDQGRRRPKVEGGDQVDGDRKVEGIVCGGELGATNDGLAVEGSRVGGSLGAGQHATIRANAPMRRAWLSCIWWPAPRPAGTPSKIQRQPGGFGGGCAKGSQTSPPLV